MEVTPTILSVNPDTLLVSVLSLRFPSSQICILYAPSDLPIVIHLRHKTARPEKFRCILGVFHHFKRMRLEKISGTIAHGATGSFVGKASVKLDSPEF